MKHTTSAPGVAPAIGPFSIAVNAGGFLFLAGQIGVNARGELAGEGIREQTEQTIRNIDAVLRACGATLTNVGK